MSAAPHWSRPHIEGISSHDDHVRQINLSRLLLQGLDLSGGILGVDCSQSLARQFQTDLLHSVDGSRCAGFLFPIHQSRNSRVPQVMK